MGYSFTPAKGKRKKYWQKLLGRKIKVAYKEYKILLSEGHIQTEDGACLGLCDFKNQKIIIDVTFGKPKVTLMHEVVHAAFESAGMHQMPDWNMNLEELCCENIANAMDANFKISID